MRIIDLILFNDFSVLVSILILFLITMIKPKWSEGLFMGWLIGWIIIILLRLCF